MFQPLMKSRPDNRKFSVPVVSFPAAFLLLFLCSINSLAQEVKKIDLLEAEQMMYDVRFGDNVNRVIGNVIFRHDNVLLYCDSAYMFTDDNSVQAMGRVHIKVNDSTSIFGDSLRYNGNKKTAEMHNNVRMVDNQITLLTDHLEYDLPKKTAHYYDGGKIIDLENTLTSKKGYYYSSKKDFFFKDSVVLVNPEYTMYSDTLLYNTQTERSSFFGPTTIVSKENFIYCERGWYDTKNDISEFRQNAYMENSEQTLAGDSIYYEQKTGLGLAYRNVVLTDKKENLILHGAFARYEQRAQYSLVTGNALMIQVDGADSLFLHADTLLATFDTTERKARVLFAFHQAKFYRDDLQGMCDSLVYRMSDSTINMYYDPVIWSEDKQLTADTIIIQTANRQIESLLLFNSSFIVSVDDSTENRYNQVKGVNIRAVFEDGHLVRVYVYEKSETLYYLREDNGQRIGVNQATGTNLLIRFQDGKIASITFLDQPAGTLHPENALSGKDRFLRDFLWRSDKRPYNKDDIFIW